MRITQPLNVVYLVDLAFKQKQEGFHIFWFKGMTCKVIYLKILPIERAYHLPSQVQVLVFKWLT